MFFTGGFNHTWEVYELVAFLVVHKVGKALGPGVLEFHQNFYQFNIILQLGIYYFYILLVFLQEGTEV